MAAITVFGAGSWGTALAILFAHNGHQVTLWGREAKVIEDAKRTRSNNRYLPGIIFPENLNLESDFARAAEKLENVVLAIPSAGLRQILVRLKPFLVNTNLLLASKGLDPESGALLHDLVTEICPQQKSLAVLAGPSFAKEVAKGLPTAVTIASTHNDLASIFAKLFANKVFRPYTSRDVIGCEIGGVVKNIIAIAVGISDGLGYGSNARAALMTRGLAEMVRLGQIMGGHLETLMGLAGVGDLILTCTDDQSRNRRFGLALGQGLSVEEAQQQIGQVVEGANNASSVYQLALRLQVELPITEQVYRVLQHNISATDAVKSLLSRAMREE